MFDVQAFLDRAKVAAHVTSDYALAVKVLGYKDQSTVTNWRKERSMPDERAILKLCALTGDDPADVALRIQAMRAANDDAAGLWESIAARLKKGGQNVAIFAWAALFLGACFVEQAHAMDALPAIDDVQPVRYVKLIALIRLLWRLGTLVYRQRSSSVGGRLAV